MELIEGVSLDNWGKGKSPREIAKKIEDVAEILDYAHGENIIHRDIKPSNIMIKKDGDKPILLDFGMARELCENSPTVTKTGEFLGTPVYASPELFAREKPYLQPHRTSHNQDNRVHL